MESGLNAVARDYARFGLLFANGGRAEGRQVVPEAWVHQATSPHAAGSPVDFYAFHWWTRANRGTPLPAGHVLAQGNLGQFVYVAPDRDLVIVRLGDEYGVDDWRKRLARLANGLSADVTCQPALCRLGFGLRTGVWHPSAVASADRVPRPRSGPRRGGVRGSVTTVAGREENVLAMRPSTVGRQPRIGRLGHRRAAWRGLPAARLQDAAHGFATHTSVTPSSRCTTSTPSSFSRCA